MGKNKDKEDRNKPGKTGRGKSRNSAKRQLEFKDADNLNEARLRNRNVSKERENKTPSKKAKITQEVIETRSKSAKKLKKNETASKGDGKSHLQNEMESVESNDVGVYVQVNVPMGENGSGSESDSDSDMGVEALESDDESKLVNENGNATPVNAEMDMEDAGKETDKRLSGISFAEFERLLWENRDMVNRVLNGPESRESRDSAHRRTQPKKKDRENRDQSKSNAKSKDNSGNASKLFKQVKSPSEDTIYKPTVEKINSSGESELSEISFNCDRLGNLNLSDESTDSDNNDNDRDNVVDDPKPSSSEYRPPSYQRSNSRSRSKEVQLLPPPPCQRETSEERRVRKLKEDDFIVQAEQSKAKLARPSGKGDNSLTTDKIDYHYACDDKFFHFATHVQKGIRYKIKKS